MTNRLSNPLNLLGSPKSAIYRPKYRTQTENPSHPLEGNTGVQRPELPGLMQTIQALEDWRSEEEARERQQASVRWHPDKVQALQVHVTLLPQQADLSPIILKAFRDWETLSGGLMRFYTCTQPDQADIVVTWSDQTTLGRDYEVGHTQTTVVSKHWIGKATISLMVQPQIDKHLDGIQARQRLYTTVLHEVGHALGLEHSTDKRDVMHHRGWKNGELSANDVRRLQELYRRPVPSLF